MLQLNLGCGLKKLPGFVNVDCEPSVAPDVATDLAYRKWPWAESSVDRVICSHLLEHIGDGFFFFLQELYRVCRPGAVVHIAVPHPRHNIFLQDPTHVRPVMPETFLGFSKQYCEEQAAKGCYYTPFWKLHGVNFHFDSAHYVIDPNIPMDLQQKAQADLRYYEQHFNNVVYEIQFDLKVVK